CAAPPHLRGTVGDDEPDPDQGRVETARPPRRQPAPAAGRLRRARARRGADRAGTPRTAHDGISVSKPSVRVLPLGGLGEIGKNMTVIESEDRIVIVDTGLRFPTA